MERRLQDSLLLARSHPNTNVGPPRSMSDLHGERIHWQVCILKVLHSLVVVFPKKRKIIIVIIIAGESFQVFDNEIIMDTVVVIFGIYRVALRADRQSSIHAFINLFIH